MTNHIADAPSICFLNQTGDVTITWDEDDYEDVVEMVKNKMAAGYTFMVVRKVTQKGRRKILKDVASMPDAAGLVVSNVVNGKHLTDDDLARLFEAGKIIISRTAKSIKHEASQSNTQTIETSHRARTAEEVVSAKTIAIRPIAGG